MAAREAYFRYVERAVEGAVPPQMGLLVALASEPNTNPEALGIDTW
jgi:hypothetical protein